MPTFWTFQNIEKLKEFQSTGILVADEKFIREEFRRPYGWIVKKMNQKICNRFPGEPCYPIWAWYLIDQPNTAQFFQTASFQHIPYSPGDSGFCLIHTYWNLEQWPSSVNKSLSPLPLSFSL